MAKKVTKPEPLNASATYKDAYEFVTLNEESKTITKRVAALKAPLKDAVTNYGKVLDENKGHIILSLDGAEGTIVLTNTCKVSTVLRPSALEVIKENFPKDVQKKLIENVEVVRDDILAQMVEEGKIDAKTLDKLYKTEDTYAFSGKIVK